MVCLAYRPPAWGRSALQLLSSTRGDPQRPRVRAGTSQQAEFSEFAPQHLRHLFGARRDAVEIARRVLGRGIGPALERAPRARLDPPALWLQYQMTAADPLLVYGV